MEDKGQIGNKKKEKRNTLESKIKNCGGEVIGNEGGRKRYCSGLGEVIEGDGKRFFHDKYKVWKEGRGMVAEVEGSV